MKKNGFTLIELIVTISLILLLFTLVFPTSTRLIQNSNKKHCEGLIDTLITSADLYSIDHNIKEDGRIIYFNILYNGGYIDSEYDFKFGYVMNETNMKNNYITVIRNIDPKDTKKGYNSYDITINGLTGKENICK